MKYELIWSVVVLKCVHILKPEKIAKSSVKIEIENKIIEDPLELAETFNIFFFFFEKIEK